MSHLPSGALGVRADCSAPCPSRARVRLGKIVWVHEVDLSTKRVQLKRVRQLITDAVGARGVVHNDRLLALAIDEAIEQSKNEDLDGFDLIPWVDGCASARAESRGR